MKTVLTAATLALTAAAHAATDARALYNEGVEKLAAGQYREAEGAFRETLIRDHGALQSPALYNLGHVRFAQGKETLKGEGNRQQLLSTSDATTALAEEVLRSGNEALGNGELQGIMGAYMQARGARKQLRGVRDETARALGLLGTALSRWRRSVGDFNSAHELDAANVDAKFNADVVERHIQELLNAIKLIEQSSANIAEERQKIKELMKQLRGKIPQDMMRESDDEEDDEDEEDEGAGGPKEEEKKGGGKKGEEPKTGKQQVQRMGTERPISPDEARLLKEMMPKRSMSQDGEGGFRASDEERRAGGRPDQRKGRDW